MKGKLMTETQWYKHTFLCLKCDAVYEISSKASLPNCFDPICFDMDCDGLLLHLLSVVNATILPIPTKKEEEMITETPAQTITLTWSENDVETSTTYSPNDVRALVYREKSYARTMNEYYRKESQLRTLLENVYADSNEQETLAQIAEIFDVSLTKEVSVTAWVRVQMTVEIDMADGDYNIEDMVCNNLTVDSFGSEITVNDYDVDRVEVY
jgi:hypothetical protein